MISAPEENNDILSHVQDANANALSALQKRMRTLYLQCKECVAISKFNSLVELEEQNGAYDDVVDALDSSHCTYKSHDFANDCIEVLATSVRAAVLAMIAESPYVGVMIDEGTDINITSQLVVYYKLVVGGVPKVVFAGVEKLVAGDGETVTRALLHRMRKDGVSVKQLMSFGSDGASVMLGHTGGVVGYLLGMNAILVAFHCINHRVALAVEGAADESS
jgi:hypothetical protein